METRILPNAGEKAFIEALMRERLVFAPVRDESGVCDFKFIASPDQAALDCAMTRASPKEAFLPRTEPLFFYAVEKGAQRITPPPAPRPQAVLGMHPCDVLALKTLDAVFLGEPSPDSLYAARRGATVIIGKAGVEHDSPCFCRELGIDPMSNEGCDMFLARLDHERWALEILTEKGAALAAAYAGLAPASESDLEILAEQRRDSAGQTRQGFDLEKIKQQLDRLFESDIWTEIHEKCVGCGACAFLCPTCHCFDIVENTRGGQGARLRIWDTCQFDLFTRHASGHNPRQSQKERARQRIMHKFSYGPEKFHVPFCVGCGRCIAFCPVNNDLRRILKAIEEHP